jgi:hypothetical protein
VRDFLGVGNFVLAAGLEVICDLKYGCTMLVSLIARRMAILIGTIQP